MTFRGSLLLFIHVKDFISFLVIVIIYDTFYSLTRLLARFKYLVINNIVLCASELRS